MSGQATIYMTSQAPHAHRTVFAMVAGLPEQNIRIISPDIGGGFGNKVPVYPGYVVATAASLVIGKPVKWVESRTENLISTGFARDYHMKGELALTNEGRILGLRVEMLSDQGAFYADAQPTQFRAGLFHVVTGSYDYPAAHVKMRGAYTNKAPGGVAYRCSFRITEASFLIERLVQTAAYELGIDPAEMRFKNFIQPEQFPYTTPTGFVYDSGDYPTALRKALDEVGYDALRAEQRQARDEGRLIGIGHRALHRGGGRGAVEEVRHPRAQDDRLRRAAGAPHRQGDPQARREVAGPGPRDDVRPDRRRRARHPVERHQGGGGRHRQHAVRPRHLRVALDAGRRRGDRDGVAQARPTRRRRSPRTCSRRPTPTSSSRTASSRWRARPTGRSPSRTSRSPRTPTCPTAWSTGSRACTTTTRRTSPIPYGSYVVVVEVDAETGVWKVQRMVALDDCGVRINPMIVEGQIHGGLTEGFAKSSMQWITFDEDGNCIGSNFMDYLIPTAWETPKFELLETCVPSPHHPIGAKGVGESATVGSPAAYVNAVIDAVAHLGVRNIDMPLLPDRVWSAIQSAATA